MMVENIDSVLNASAISILAFVVFYTFRQLLPSLFQRIDDAYRTSREHFLSEIDLQRSHDEQLRRETTESILREIRLLGQINERLCVSLESLTREQSKLSDIIIRHDLTVRGKNMDAVGSHNEVMGDYVEEKEKQT